MARYLVTGGAGFIGSHLCDELIATGHEVSVLDNLSTGKVANLPREVEFFAGDVADQISVQHAARNVDGIFHLAAVASVEKSNHAWSATHRTNLFGSVTVFEAACDSRPESPLPVVYASSAAVYGASTSAALSEEHPTSPLSAYGADKLATELHARVGGLTHALRTTGLRFFNVYGPRQDPHSPYSGAISILLDRILNRQSLTVHGDGKQSRDFIYVGDVTRFLIAAMNKASVDAPVLNVCTGTQTSILNLINTLSLVFGLPADLKFAPARQGDIRHSCGNPEAATRVLEISATIDLANGLRCTHAYALSDTYRALAS